jgi:hypothetical protein
MTKTISTLVLSIALFCLPVLADDGNMGGSGYTGCDGNNPPPTCTCDPVNPCNGFAATQGTNDADVNYDLTTITVDEIGNYILSIY